MSSQGDLLVKIGSKFGNTSTKFYTNDDRINALNWARDVLGMFDFPELMKVITLTLTPQTFLGQSISRCLEPTDFRRTVKLWDITNKQYQYLEPNAFDNSQSGSYTRQYDTDIRYFMVKPNTLTSLYLRYIKTIQLFTTTSNYNNEFDSRFDDCIVDGAIGWLQLKGKNYEDQQLYFNQFHEKVSRMFQDLSRPGGFDDHTKLSSYYESYTLLEPMSSMLITL